MPKGIAEAKKAPQTKKVGNTKKVSRTRKAAKARKVPKQGADAEQGAEQGAAAEHAPHAAEKGWNFKPDTNGTIWIDFANMCNVSSCIESLAPDLRWKEQAHEIPFITDDLHADTEWLNTPWVAPTQTLSDVPGALEAPQTGVVLGPNGQPRMSNACRRI